jgi:hypothetical protein
VFMNVHFAHSSVITESFFFLFFELASDDVKNEDIDLFETTFFDMRTKKIRVEKSFSSE